MHLRHACRYWCFPNCQRSYHPSGLLRNRTPPTHQRQLYPSEIKHLFCVLGHMPGRPPRNRTSQTFAFGAQTAYPERDPFFFFLLASSSFFWLLRRLFLSSFFNVLDCLMSLERVERIELSYRRWKPRALPLSYARISL